jgi:hypothetical protein
MFRPTWRPSSGLQNAGSYTLMSGLCGWMLRSHHPRSTVEDTNNMCAKSYKYINSVYSLKSKLKNHKSKITSNLKMASRQAETCRFTKSIYTTFTSCVLTVPLPTLISTYTTGMPQLKTKDRACKCIKHHKDR